MGFDEFQICKWIDFLRWKVKCFEADGDSFQQIFEDVMQVLKPGEFMPIKPCGRLGDMKTDGLLYGDGKAYQVYSPDSISKDKTLKKIEEDLAGCVDEWGDDLNEWTFVYNVRRGVYPQIPQKIKEEQEKYDDIVLDHMSNRGIWDKIKELPIQKRSEILGPPPSDVDYRYPDNEGNNMKKIKNSRIVVFHEGDARIDKHAALKALKPENPFGPPLRIDPNISDLSWEEASEYQREEIQDLIDQFGRTIARFAIFSFSNIPLCVHLGFTLSDRYDVDLYQYHRDENTWDWDRLDDESFDKTINTSGMLQDKTENTSELAISVSLSAKIKEEDIEEACNPDHIISLSVDNPSVNWLRSKEQINALQKTFRKVLSNASQYLTKLERIHLFIAGPTPASIAIGQAINETMNPPIELYYYEQSESPKYTNVLTLIE